MNATTVKNEYCLPDKENPEWTDDDFARAKPNRFARSTITLDEDVAKYFPTDKEVNEALRMVIQLVERVHPH